MKTLDRGLWSEHTRDQQVRRKECEPASRRGNIRRDDPNSFNLQASRSSLNEASCLESSRSTSFACAVRIWVLRLVPAMTFAHVTKLLWGTRHELIKQPTHRWQLHKVPCFRRVLPRSIISHPLDLDFLNYLEHSNRLPSFVFHLPPSIFHT